jgi:acetyl-CoA synthetase
MVHALDTSAGLEAPHAKWFVGGTLNASVNCVDRHVRGPRRNKAAHHLGGEPGDRRTLTYFDLVSPGQPVRQRPQTHGREAGDRVAIYLPLVPELAIAMLACARIGAVHSSSSAASAATRCATRINDAQATLLITADGGWRRGQVVPLKQMADVALEGTPSIENVIIVRAAGGHRCRCTIRRAATTGTTA